jgi:flagellar motor switch protein FliM
MSKIFSQDEVDALLKGMSGGEIEVETDAGPGADGVIVYDLTNQDRIIRGRMPTLEIINDRFARLYRTTLSSALRKIVDMTTTSVDMVKFGEFMRSLPVPTSLHIFKMDPLRGHAIFVLESKLVFNLVETFFGRQRRRRGQDRGPRLHGHRAAAHPQGCDAGPKGHGTGLEAGARGDHGLPAHRNQPPVRLHRAAL